MEDIKHEILREGADVILKIDYESSLRAPSVEDDPVTMAKTINLLLEEEDNSFSIENYLNRTHDF